MLTGKKTLIITYLCMLLTEIGYGNMIILLPLYLNEHLKFSVSAVGVIVSMYSVAELLMKTPSGWLSDRWGRKPVFAGSIFLIGISFFLLEWSSSYWLVLLLAMIGGAGVAAIWPINVVITADIVKEEEIGPYLGLISTICLAGKGIAPAVGSLAIYLTHSYDSLLLGNALLCAIAFILVFFFVKEPGRSESEEKKGSIKDLLCNYPRLWILSLILFLQTLSIGVLMPIIGLYFSKELGIDVEMLGPILLLPVILVAILNYLSGLLSDKIGRKKPIYWGLLLMAISFYLFPVRTECWYLCLVGLLFGLGYALMIPAWTAMITEESPSDQRGTVLGLVGTLQVFGLAVAPIIGTLLWDHLGTWAPFAGGGVFLTICTIVTIWSIRGKKNGG